MTPYTGVTSGIRSVAWGAMIRSMEMMGLMCWMEERGQTPCSEAVAMIRSWLMMSLMW